MRAAGEGRTGIAGVYFALVVISLLTIFPLFWMVSSAFKTGTDVYSLSPIPERPTLDNFRYVFTQVPFLRYMFNSLFVSVSVTVIALFFHSMAAYALARLRFPGRELIFTLIFSTLLVSLPVILVPLFVLVRAMGMLNSYAGLIIPVIFHAFGIFLLRQFYLGVPKELEEAAYLDGASQFRTFLQVSLPLALPSIAVAGIIAFLTAYSEFTIGWLFLDRSDKITLAMAIYSIVQTGSAQPYSQLGSLAIIVSIPAIAIFVLFQNTLLERMLFGSINE